MRSRSLALIAVLVLFITPSIAGEEEIRIDSPTNSLVFGYIDMSDAPTEVKGAWLEQVAPPTDAPYWSMGIEKGLFYNTFIQPGSYKVSKFAGSSFMKGAHEYHFPRQGRNETAVVIEEPGIYFLGAYKYEQVQKAGMFSKATFTIERISEPTEADLLTRILEDEMKIQKSKGYKGPSKVKIKETVWGERIRARLAELER